MLAPLGRNRRITGTLASAAGSSAMCDELQKIRLFGFDCVRIDLVLLARRFCKVWRRHTAALFPNSNGKSLGSPKQALPGTSAEVRWERRLDLRHDAGLAYRRHSLAGTNRRTHCKSRLVETRIWVTPQMQTYLAKLPTSLRAQVLHLRDAIRSGRGFTSRRRLN